MFSSIIRKSSGQGFIIAVILLCAVSAFPQALSSVRVEVDATEVSRNIVHVKETVNVRPGLFTLFYPKWIPGEHKPTGPINNMVNLRITANGKPLEWNRDDVEMFAFTVTVPSGVNRLNVSFDDVAESGTTSSANLARLKWNRLVMYPRNFVSDAVQVTATLKMPVDWKCATALPVASETGQSVDFKPVSLTTFIDSPAQIGRYFKKVTLSSSPVVHEMDIAADTEEALAYKPETLDGWKNLVKEAGILYGARHYNSYRFLLTLSDYGGSEGLEHHESSEDGVGLTAFSDEEGLYDLADLLSHEYTHSWNGKYRRPAGLATPEFETPMHADLLWVYEGLTQYLGYVLAARSGMWTPEVFRETVADVSAQMATQQGRKWRPLVDTARAVQFSYSSPRQWQNERRAAEYYYEGMMVWLDADVLIRTKSGGKRSLDDFIHAFHGGQNTGPMLRTYTLSEVVATLNRIQPYDWNTFFRQRVYAVNTNAPLGGIENGGWRLEYSEQPNTRIGNRERLYNYLSAMYSVGLNVASDGTVNDVNSSLAGARAGLAPGMKLMGPDGKPFSLQEFTKAVADSKTTTIVLTAANGPEIKSFNLDYRGGARYPHLVRDMTKPDILAEIIKGH